MMLNAIGLEKRYEGPAGDLRILRGVNLQVSRGDLAFILGRSGAGKSTLLHLLGGLDRSTKGKVEFEGTDLAALGERELAEYRSRKIGFVFQFYHLLPELTVMENVELPSRIAGKRFPGRAEELLERVGLSARSGHLPSELSGGERQRAAIARALINRPEIIFCDEPTGNLDEETQTSIQKLILDLNEEGQTFCIVTHEESFAQKGNRIYRLHDGVVQLNSTVSEGVKP
ncbi:MAG: hypothetical protein A3A73_02400 [Omnitrophica bacterium RIFCSPLOWO2_01_FULL_50_24]|nr:MAG: hypothetical protein A3A73_02400 [Omnitrophica bacterium RIFCSPLOWO2_01_FULL_50_24]